MAHSKVWNWNASPVMKNKILSALLIAILAVSWVGVSPEFAVAQDADPGKQKVEKKKDRKKDNDTGGIYKSTDGGESWKRINSLNPRPFYYSQLIVDPSDDRHMYVMGVSFHESHDGGATFKTGGKRVHPDHHALWVNSRDGRRLILGCDGGLYKSYDRGQTWDFHNIMDIGQFYDVGVDTRNPYWVYGGLHRVQWNLRADPPKRSPGSSSRSRTGPSVRPGVYLAKLTVDGKEFVEEICVNSDPDFPAAMLLEELNEFEAKERPGYLA
jgi:hypothetical protein